MSKTRKKDFRTDEGSGLKKKSRAATRPVLDRAEQDPEDHHKSHDRAQLIGAIREMVLPLAAEMDLDLVEIQYRRESGRMVLRLFVDHYLQTVSPADPGSTGVAQPLEHGSGGITLDELTKLSRELSLLLDLADFLPDRYILEVSSPGLDRLLDYPDDFQRYRNRRVSLRLKAGDDSKQSLKGFLEGLNSQGDIVFQPDGAPPGEKPLLFPAGQLVSARLAPRINWRPGTK